MSAVKGTRHLLTTNTHEFTRIAMIGSLDQGIRHLLRRDAVRLVLEGRSTIEEAMRINNMLED